MADPADRGNVWSWVALGLVVPFPTLAVLMAAWWFPGGTGQIFWAFAKVWTACWPAIAWIGVEGRRWSLSRPERGGLGVGALSGIAIALFIGLFFFLFGRGALSSEALHQALVAAGLTSPGIFLAGAVYWTTLNSLLEEYMWRWFVLIHLERLLPAARAPLAPIFSALLFSVHHFFATLKFCPLWAALLATGGVFIGGWLWGWLYQRYRSIWPAYVSHAIVDVAVYAIGWAVLYG